jgi:hypothetical protein
VTLHRGPSSRATDAENNAGAMEQMRPAQVPRAARLLLIVGVFHTVMMVWISASALAYGDFPQLHASARAALTGGDLYATGPTIQHTKNLNPPHLALVMAPLGALSVPTAAFVMWGVLLMAAVVYAAAIARTFSFPQGHTVFGVVLSSAASGVAVSLINVAWPLAAATAWAWVWQREGRRRRSAIAIGCLASFKLFYLIFVSYWLWRRDFASALWAVAGLCAVTAAGMLIVGFEPYSEWISALREGSPLLSDRPLDASWHSVVTRLALDNRSALGLWIAGCAAGVLISWWRLRRETDDDVHWAVVLTAMIIFSPLGWIYYALIPALPLALVLIRHQSVRVLATLAACWLVPPVAVVWAASQARHGIGSAMANSFYALTLVGTWLTILASNAGARSSSPRTNI